MQKAPTTLLEGKLDPNLTPHTHKKFQINQDVNEKGNHKRMKRKKVGEYFNNLKVKKAFLNFAIKLRSHKSND